MKQSRQPDLFARPSRVSGAAQKAEIAEFTDWTPLVWPQQPAPDSEINRWFDAPEGRWNQSGLA